MEQALRERLEQFLRPLYQGLDGVSGMDEVERLSRIARRLHRAASPAEERAFELLLLFHGLGGWLTKVGNLTRVLLAIGSLTEQELRKTAASIRRLETPQSSAERALAAARLIDRAGVYGLTIHFVQARREGSSLMDVLRATLSDTAVPEWLPAEAEAWLMHRREARREVCRRILEELDLSDDVVGV